MYNELELTIQACEILDGENEKLKARIAKLEESLLAHKKCWQVSTERNNELKVRVEQLRDLLIRAVKGEQYIIESDLIAAIGSDLQSEISEAIDATPSQCLAEIKAQAVEDAVKNTHTHRLHGEVRIFHCHKALLQYANQLRQQAIKENKL